VFNVPDAYVEHQIPGRVRVRIPSKRKDAEYFSSLTAHFSRLAGVEAVTVNPLTGGMLLIHTTELEAISGYAKEKSLFHIGQVKKQQPVSKSVMITLEGLNEKVKDITGGSFDMPTVAFFSLLGIGIYQIGRGNLMAIPWYVALWYATNILLQSQTQKSDIPTS
jgi:hypothetical protein